MNRSPLLLTNDVRFCVSGTVTIHPTAAIATNVILRANPGSCLVIGAGVVVGEGSVIQSYGGSLVIEDGVTLGSQVLLIGQGVVRQNACIGSLSTLMANIAVMEGEMIPAHSLVGAPEPQAKNGKAASGVENSPSESEKPGLEEENSPSTGQSASESVPESPSDDIGSPSNQSESPELPHPDSHRMFMPINTPRYSGGAVDDVNAGRELGKSSTDKNQSSEDKEGQNQENAQADKKDDSIEKASGSSGTNKPSASSVIYGKSSVQRLMTMMFPYRTLNNSGDDKE